MATAVTTGRLTASEYSDAPEVPDRAELVHGTVHVMAPAASFVRAGRLPSAFGPWGCVRLAPDLGDRTAEVHAPDGVMRTVAAS